MLDQVGWAGVVVAAICIAIAFFVLFSARPKLIGLRKPRTKCVLAGLSGAGKTLLFAQLCQDWNPKTQTSMVANSGVFKRGDSSDLPVVDYPGHRRLRGGLYAHLDEAKVVVAVVDATTVEEEKEMIGDFFCDLIQSASTMDLKKLIIACNKRDLVTSYGASACRQKIESELTRVFATRSGSVGSIGKKASDQRRGWECEGEFRFDSLPFPVEFIETSCVESSPDALNLSKLKAALATV